MCFFNVLWRYVTRINAFISVLIFQFPNNHSLAFRQSSSARGRRLEYGNLCTTFVEELVLWTDGSAHPNPGPRGAAIVAQKPGKTQWETKQCPLGRVASNNRAKLTALHKAVKHVRQCCESHPDLRRALILSDSKTAINQVTGLYKARLNLDILKKIHRKLKDAPLMHAFNSMK